MSFKRRMKKANETRMLNRSGYVNSKRTRYSVRRALEELEKAMRFLCGN